MATSAPRLLAAIRTRPAPLLAGAVGVLLWWWSRFHPGELPPFLPWDFSWAWYLGFVGIAGAYWRGLRTAPRPAWRTAFFITGLAVLWAVLQTRYDYLAQHMFFLNRIQHVAMHHLGPFLIAVAWPWGTIRAGLPRRLRDALDRRWCVRLLGVFQQPDVASFLFVGLIALWLIPSVHFVAMISPALYQVMNWSMVVDGLLFWSVVLDPRSPEQAHNGFAARAIMGVGVMFPQIAIGAVLAFANRDLYTFYAWCGRLYPSIDALSDQRIGGLIVWIPPAMMSALSLILVLNHARIDSEARAPARVEGQEAGISSASWTGR